MSDKPYKYYRAYRGGCDGTSLRGYIGPNINYMDLQKVFGPDHYGPSPDHKVDWEWEFRFYFEDDTYEGATLYNWKDGPNHCCLDALDSGSKERKWNIGGKSYRVVECIRWAFENKDKPTEKKYEN